MRPRPGPVEALVRQAAGRGAQIVLPQELFAAPYFCRDELQTHFALARPIDGLTLYARYQQGFPPRWPVDRP